MGALKQDVRRIGRAILAAVFGFLSISILHGRDRSPDLPEIDVFFTVTKGKLSVDRGRSEKSIEQFEHIKTEVWDAAYLQKVYFDQLDDSLRDLNPFAYWFLTADFAKDMGEIKTAVGPLAKLDFGEWKEYVSAYNTWCESNPGAKKLHAKRIDRSLNLSSTEIHFRPLQEDESQNQSFVQFSDVLSEIFIVTKMRPCWIEPDDRDAKLGFIEEGKLRFTLGAPPKREEIKILFKSCSSAEEIRIVEMANQFLLHSQSKCNVRKDEDKGWKEED